MNDLSDGITEQDRGDGKDYEIGGGAQISRDLGNGGDIHILANWAKGGEQTQNNGQKEKARLRAFCHLLWSIPSAYGKRGCGSTVGVGVSPFLRLKI